MYGQRHCVASYKKNAQWANHFTCRRVDVANRKSLRRPTLSSTQTLVSQILTEYNVALFSLWYSLLPLSLDCDGINLCFPILFKVLLYAMCAVKVFIQLCNITIFLHNISSWWSISSTLLSLISFFRDYFQKHPPRFSFFLHNLWIIWISTGFPLDKRISLCYNNITGIICSQEQGLIMV